MPTLTTIAQSETVADAQAGWSQTLSVRQFDPTLGFLQDVRLTLVGDVTASASIENVGPAATTVDLSLPAVVSVTGNGVAASANVDPTGLLNLGAYDGTTDYAGASGTVVPLTGSQTVQSTFTLTGTDAAAFTGTGTVDLTASSNVGSDETGDANLLTMLQTDAGAVVSVSYDYAPSAGGSGAVVSGGGGGGTDITTTVPLTVPTLVSIPNTDTTAPATYTVPDSPSGWSDLLAVAPFDPSLGTLQAVDIALSGDLTGTVAAQTLDGSTVALAVSEQGTIAIDLGPASSLSYVSRATFENPPPIGSFGTFVPGPTVVAALNFLDATQPAESITDPTLLAEFAGGSTVDIPISSIGSSDVQGGANLLTALTQDAGATIQLSYIYTPDSVACFASGTRIATPAGPIAVEDLTVGQTVLTQAGRHAPIAWIGHRSVDCVRHPQPAAVWPVHIRTGAFAPRQPERDLFLSPDHAVAVDGVLIPASSLINGETIVQQPRATITYWHVELDRHDVVLAEGLPVESFLDTGNRGAFANGGPAVQLHPAFASWRWEAAGCAPLVVIGPVLDAVRARLADRGPASRAATPMRPSRARSRIRRRDDAGIIRSNTI